MANVSAYLGLTLPDESDLADISVLTANFSALDEKAEDVDDNISTLQSSTEALGEATEALGEATEALENGKLAKSSVYNGLDKSEVGCALDACQGEVLVAMFTPIEVTSTLLATSWSGEEAPHTQVVSVSGMTATKKVIIGLASTATAGEYKAAGKAMLFATAQGDGTITVNAYGTVPEIDIPILVRFEGA